MRKFGLGIMIASAALLGACSDDGKYEKLMKKADAAMEESDVDAAIGYYEEILALEPGSYAYSSSRHWMVEELLSDAEGLKGQLSYLEEQYNSVKGILKETEFTLEKLDEVTTNYSLINYVYNEVESYPTTSYYKDVLEIKTSFEKELKEKFVSKLVEGIDKDIEDEKFDAASEKVAGLTTIQEYYNDAIDYEKIADYQSKIEAELARYLLMPIEYTKRNQEIYADKSVGTVTLLGEGYHDGYLSLIYKVEGDLAPIAEEFDISTLTVFKDGSNRETENGSYYNFGDYTLIVQHLTDEEKEIHRVDYNVSLQNKEDMQTIEFKEVSDKESTEALMGIEAEKTIATDIKLEHKDYTVNVKELVVDPDFVTVTGSVTTNKDLEISDTMWLNVENISSQTYENLSGDYFAGVETEFSLTFDTENPILDSSKTLSFELFDMHFQVDAKTGKLVTPESSKFMTAFPFETTDALDGYNYIYGDSTLFADVDGTKFADVYAIHTDGWYANSEEGANFEVTLSKRYSKFVGKIGLRKETSTDGYGSSVVKIKGDGNVLKEYTLKAGQKTVDVDLDVSNVEKLQVELVQTEGNDGYQQVLLADFVLTK